MKSIERHRQTWQGKSDEWLFERLDNELKQKVEEIHRLLAENEALRKLTVIKSVSFDDFKTWGKCFETFITRNSLHGKWDRFIEQWESEQGTLPPDYTHYEKEE